MTDSRLNNALRNSAMASISQIASILLSFIGRTFFIKLLSLEYLGINGLFSNILSLLSLAELGFGTAITYMMYKPIAEHDIAKVSAYNLLFKRIYNAVGLFILTVGLAFTPFINSLIKETPNIPENIYLIYALFVLNTSISYFFTYKRSLLIAYQKEYINSQNIVVFAIIKDIVLITLLVIFNDYYVYLLAQIVITYASNLTISYKTNKLFPDVISTAPKSLSRLEIMTILKNTMAMISHKVGSVAVSSTGNIFISYYVGISTVGIYSNYVLIYTCANQIIGKSVNSLTASFGNLVATSSKDNVYAVFKRVYFINFVLALSVAIIFTSLIEPFITIWIGSDYLLDVKSLMLIVVNSIFFYQIRIPSQMVINTCGLFWQIKWKSIVEAVINLVCAFVFAGFYNLGIKGILLAVLVSNISTSLWWEPYVAFKYGMRHPFKNYIFEFLKNIVLLFIAIIIIFVVNNKIDDLISNIFINSLIRIFVSIILLSFLIFISYSKTEEYKYFISLIKKIKNH